MKRTFGDSRFFHSQVRVGKRAGVKNTAIVVTKFRTMVPGAHKDFDRAVPHPEALFSDLPDSRNLRFGKFFRRTKLDELPQIMNLARGELRLVGWRPITKITFEKLPADIQAMYGEMGPGLFGIYYVLPKKKRTEENVHAEYRRFFAAWKKGKLGAYAKYLPKILLNALR